MSGKLLSDAMNDEDKGIPPASQTYGVKPPTALPPRRAVQQEVIEKVVEIIPSNAMLVNEDNTISVGRYTFTGTGLITGEGSTFEEWQAVGSVLLRLDAAIQWLIGDWINQGEKIYGQTYAQIAEWSGREVKTLQNYVYVASNVEISLRRENLTFGHHALVTPLPPVEQDYWLNEASTGGWSIAKMRKEMLRDEVGEGDDSVSYIVPIQNFVTQQIKRAQQAEAHEREQMAVLLEEAAKQIRNIPNK